MQPMKLDEIDVKILHHLQREARISNVELANRVGLSPAPCLRRVRSLEEAGTRFHLLDVGGLSVTVTTAAGLFFLTIMSAVAEYENGRRRERQTENYSSQRARRNATGTGVFFGAEPYGFTCQPHPTVTDAKVLVRCPTEGPILDRSLTGDLSTLSANETARRLNAGGIATKKGGQWYGATVGSVRKTSGTEVAA